MSTGGVFPGVFLDGGFAGRFLLNFRAVKTGKGRLPLAGRRFLYGG